MFSIDFRLQKPKKVRSIIETTHATANLDPINEDNITLGVILRVHQESIIKVTLQMKIFCNFSELIFTHPYCKVVMPSVYLLSKIIK